MISIHTKIILNRNHHPIFYRWTCKNAVRPPRFQHPMLGIIPSPRKGPRIMWVLGVTGACALGQRPVASFGRSRTISGRKKTIWNCFTHFQVYLCVARTGDSKMEWVLGKAWKFDRDFEQWNWKNGLWPILYTKNTHRKNELSPGFHDLAVSWLRNRHKMVAPRMFTYPSPISMPSQLGTICTTWVCPNGGKIFDK